ncbi:phosphoenolpyruvate--protein phosphotransferase [Rubripirellula obstinata]|uniref:phosphoenolpyruvate--protein phosphotransferase n=1 Tax=Rubripirellula obstinata TaxID=406547 RepID=UPI0013598274|nr:phosphoenolpyruvate--protein phosphotransferase [Rubripirellula obstinata]
MKKSNASGLESGVSQSDGLKTDAPPITASSVTAPSITTSASTTSASTDRPRVDSAAAANAIATNQAPTHRGPSPERMGLSTLEDISHLILQSHGLTETLQNIVSLVANRMQSEVCSIYLCEENHLALSASVGLAAEAVGSTRLKIGEGLVGYTAKTCSVVNLDEPQLDERYQHVLGSAEEQYHSFLGIPLFDRQNLIGVMAIQTIQPRVFSEVETSTLSTIAFQLSSVVASTRLLEQLDFEAGLADDIEEVSEQETQTPIPLVKSKFGFGTVAIGPAILIDNAFGVSDVRDDVANNPAAELQKLESAFAAARVETLCLEKKIAQRLDEADAAIFHSHLMILQDNVLIGKIKALIENGASAISAAKQIITEYVRTFSQLRDPYLRGRAADVEDVGRRLLSQLCGDLSERSFHFPHPGIVVADELMASDIAIMDLDHVRGIVLGRGDKNGHAVIVAKSLGIPTLVGVPDVLTRVKNSTLLVLDAQTQTLHIDPSPELRQAYERLEAESDAKTFELQKFVTAPTVTKDGTKVTLRSNIGLRSDVDVAIRSGATGVGLYRTELPYMARSSFPDRQTQYEIYRHVVEGFAGESVTIRTLDIGGDKSLSYFKTPAEENPFLGWRSVRVSLEHRDMFRTQIEAILMAAVHGNARIMFPMITNLDEIVACKEVLAEAKANLAAEGFKVPEIPVGMMIETPASATMADRLAKEVDFFSLGTNDLVQYILATDRGNPRVGHYYQSLHPAVLHAIASLVDVTQRHDIGLSICGEMVSDPATFALLVGMGLREFSASSPAILPLKAMLAQQDISQLKRLASNALNCDSAAEVLAIAEEAIGLQVQ